MKQIPPWYEESTTDDWDEIAPEPALYVACLLFGGMFAILLAYLAGGGYV